MDTVDLGDKRLQERAMNAIPAAAIDPPSVTIIAGDSALPGMGGAPPPLGTSAAGEASGLGVGAGPGVGDASAPASPQFTWSTTAPVPSTIRT